MPEWKETVHAPEEEAEGPVIQAQSKSKALFKKFMQRRIAVAAAMSLLILLIITAVGPELAPYDPAAPDYGDLLSGPSPAHVLGTDEYGRDVLNRLMAGSRLTLGVSLSSVVIGTAIGTFLDVLAGYYSGILGTFVTRGSDVLFAFPDILLTIAIVAMIDPGIVNVVIAVVVFTVPSFARIIRSVTPSVKESLYVEVTRSIGCKSGRILSMCISPGAMQAMIVNFTIRADTAILAAASLSFLGFGANVTEPDWGAMLSSGRNYIGVASHLAYFPGLLIFLTVLVFNPLDDGLRDMLDPKIKQDSACISIFYFHTTEFPKGSDQKGGYQNA